MTTNNDTPLLAIIGTAGRGDDGKKITLGSWIKTKRVVLNFIEDWGITEVISGGAALSDHLAVELFLSSKTSVNHLSLRLPCEFDTVKNEFIEESIYNPRDCGRSSNRYHYKAEEITGINSLEQIGNVIGVPKVNIKIGDGFFSRNDMVADEANMLLALTFGEGNLINDGGTAYTARKFIRKNGNKNAFHIDLNTNTLYNNAITS